MAITVEPQSTITLVKCKLEADLKNTFTFSSLANQTTYFNGLTKKVIGSNNYAYVKKDNMVEVDEPIDSIIQYNYMYYTNTGFSNKRFYCFIDRMEYSNENATKIYFHTDVFQTWYFQLEWNRCFVEREHVNDDSVGANTVPEKVELGGYIHNVKTNVPTNAYQELFTNSDEVYFCVWAGDAPSDVKAHFQAGSTTYNGVPWSSAIVVLEAPIGVQEYLEILGENNMSESIVSVFIIPRSIVKYDDYTTSTITWYTDISGSSLKYGIISNSDHEAFMQVFNKTITMPTTLDNYSPKNNKLLTWPYNYFYVSNNAGSDVEFRYEDFVNNTPAFEVIGAITPGCSIRCHPLNYKKLQDTLNYVTPSNNTAYSYNYGITGAKYPICPYNSDIFTNWLTEQGVNISLGLIGSVASIGVGAGLILTGAGTGVGIGMVAGGITGVGSSLSSVYTHSMTPDQSRGNTNAGDVQFSSRKMSFGVHKMCIRAEYARIIDEYFTMFGYKVNRVKTPNITGRSQWNFIKTIDCNVDGDIPQEDLETIRSACNSGITFWHNPANIYNYSLNNPIV